MWKCNQMNAELEMEIWSAEFNDNKKAWLCPPVLEWNEAWADWCRYRTKYLLMEQDTWLKVHFKIFSLSINVGRY